MTDEEQKIKAALGALREEDQKTAPPFDPMWKRASERAGAPQPRPAAPLRGPRIAMVASGLAAAAGVVLFVSSSMRSRSAPQAWSSPAAAPVTPSPAVAATATATPTVAVSATAASTPTQAPTLAPTVTPTLVARASDGRLPPLALDFLLRTERDDLAALTSFDLDPRFGAH